MGIVLLNTKSIDSNGMVRAYIECSDINTDITECIEENKKNRISEKNMMVLIENSENTEESDLMLSIDEFNKAKEKLKFITSHIREEDSQEEKFAKIVTSLHKHVKYAYTKTGNRNVGKSQNFIDGLTKGRCVCIGMAQILREALLMNGIDCTIVESVDKNDSGHQWNKVLLGKNWYNWDQTNIKANILSLNNIGKNLQTDEQMKNKKIYQYYTGDIYCGTPPTEELIKKVNHYAKLNKNKYPRQDNIFSKIFRRNKKEKVKALPQTAEENKKENLQIGDIEIIEQEKIVPYIYHNIDLWKIKTCNTKDISKKIRTLYLGLDFQDDIEKLTKEYKEEFWRVFYSLIDSSDDKNYTYIGSILRRSNFENKGLKGITPTSPKSRKIIKEVNDAILDDIDDEKIKIKAAVNKQEAKETKTH